MRRFFFNANHLITQGLVTEHNYSNSKKCSASGYMPNSPIPNGSKVKADQFNNTGDISEQAAYTATALTSLASETILTLPDDVYHHWCRVLRAKEGDKSILFDGLGGEVIVTLENIDKKNASARLISTSREDNTPLFYSTIAIVMSRGDRMDYAIQKSTELGATKIQLLTSQYGEVRLKSSQIDKKLNHWQQVALSASEQCGLNKPPIVLSPIPVEEWLQGKVGKSHESVSYLLSDPFYQEHDHQDPLQLVLAVPNQEERTSLEVDKTIKERFANTNSSCIKSGIKTETKNATNTKKATKTGTKTVVNIAANTAANTAAKPRFDILIGAEGGLSETEYQLSRQAGYLPWQLGTRVLRTETAPVVALSTLLYISSSQSNL